MSLVGLVYQVANPWWPGRVTHFNSSNQSINVKIELGHSQDTGVYDTASQDFKATIWKKLSLPFINFQMTKLQ